MPSEQEAIDPTSPIAPAAADTSEDSQSGVDPSSLLGAFANVLGRMVASTLGLLGAAVLVVLSALPFGGGGGEALAFAAFAVFFLCGWTLLPLVRASRVLAIIILCAWIGAALRFFWFGKPWGGGLMVLVWFSATTFLLICLVRCPPHYLRLGRDESEEGEG